MGGGFVVDIEHDLAVANMFARDARAGVDRHREVGREAVVATPLVNGANQVGFGRRQIQVHFLRVIDKGQSGGGQAAARRQAG
jgi:hypothetical protein